MNIAMQTDMLAETAANLLACPKCHTALDTGRGALDCGACGYRAELRDGVVVARALGGRSYFDDAYRAMQSGNHTPGTWDVFYQDQVALMDGITRDGLVVVDVGCGPELLYRKNGAFVIGLDASFESVRANHGADLKIYATAAEIPLRSASVDVVVCFYAVHHMTGQTIAENGSIVESVFREFGRILAPGGRLMVFDVSPRWPFGALEQFAWNAGKRRLGAGLDMYFWERASIERLAGKVLGAARYVLHSFRSSPFTRFPPIFTKPSLQLPRMLYPFDVNLYQWTMPRL